ncbi:unnamed protein product [Amoebophrya sp. A120]|nr:unnamed protein product [Amoebophrya sp. A120]|eukprot:GSA120T00014939001.1
MDGNEGRAPAAAKLVNSAQQRPPTAQPDRSNENDVDMEIVANDPDHDPHNPTETDLLHELAEQKLFEIPKHEVVEKKWALLKNRFGFYGDKYQPETIEELDYGIEQVTYTEKVLDDSNFPHMLFVGPAGSGKKTRILCLLRRMFGKIAINESKVVHAKVNNVDVKYIESPVHTELDVSLSGSKDSKVLCSLLLQGVEAAEATAKGGSKTKDNNGGGANNFMNKKKPLLGQGGFFQPQQVGGDASNVADIKNAGKDIPAGSTIDRHEPTNTRGKNKTPPPLIRVFVIYNASLLSMEAQSALRRTMEIVSKYRKVFLVCQDAQQLIDPIQGRCTRVRICSPDDQTICRILARVVERERLANLVDLNYNPTILDELYQHITSHVKGDLKQALWMLQASFAKKSSEAKLIQPVVPEWVRVVEQRIVKKIQEDDFNSNETLGKVDIAFEGIVFAVEQLLISVEPEVLLMHLRRKFLSELDFYKKSVYGRTQLLKQHCEIIQRVRNNSAFSSSVSPIANSTVMLHVLAFISFAIGQIFDKKQKDDDRHMRRSLLEFYQQRQAEEADPVLQEKLKQQRMGLDKPKLTLL